MWLFVLPSHFEWVRQWLSGFTIGKVVRFSAWNLSGDELIYVLGDLPKTRDHRK